MVKRWYQILSIIFLFGSGYLIFIGEFDRALIGFLFSHIYRLRGDLEKTDG